MSFTLPARTSSRAKLELIRETPKPAATNCAGVGRREKTGNKKLAYRMIAERENETIKIERKSSLLIVAKAKVWASEGWHVVITDAEGKAYAPAEFDRLLAA